MSEEIAIRVSTVSKDFVLPHQRANSVKSIFTGIASKQQKQPDEVQHALKDISFEIKKGEFFGIVGRNGSGKSTMLKILAGIYQPTNGSVHTSGKLVPFIELGVGFNPELTGRENVYLNGAMLGFSEKEVSRMYDGIVEFAELEKFMDQKLKNYSSGMQVRLAFSMATRAKADILLVDEVLAVGDADFQRKCFNYFKQLKKNKKTVVFVSHDMDAVRQYCDRAALIEKSELKALGDTRLITDQYTELFSGEQIPSDEANIENRHGNGTVKADTVKLDKKVYTDKDTEVKITVTLKAYAENQDLMTGLRISNAYGQTLHETNTWNEKIDLPELAIGQTCQVTWTCPNIYTDGQYKIDVFVYGRGNVMFDSWVESSGFSMKRPKNVGFLVSPPLGIKVKK